MRVTGEFVAQPATLIRAGETAMTGQRNIKLIPLSQGKYAIVDAEDYERLMQWKWYRTTIGYAARTMHFGYKNGRKIKTDITMHRFIMNTPKGMDTDHINGDRLDNRRCNLRICSHSENCKNLPIRKNLAKKSSKYKGVSWDKKTKKWVAKIMVNRVHKILGYFCEESLAAHAYNKAATECHGEFARINEFL